jgi:hypothetical protein
MAKYAWQDQLQCSVRMQLPVKNQQMEPHISRSRHKHHRRIYSPSSQVGGISVWWTQSMRQHHVQAGLQPVSIAPTALLGDVGVSLGTWMSILASQHLIHYGGKDMHGEAMYCWEPCMQRSKYSKSAHSHAHAVMHCSVACTDGHIDREACHKRCAIVPTPGPSCAVFAHWTLKINSTIWTVKECHKNMASHLPSTGLQSHASQGCIRAAILLTHSCSSPCANLRLSQPSRHICCTTCVLSQLICSLERLVLS